MDDASGMNQRNIEMSGGCSFGGSVSFGEFGEVFERILEESMDEQLALEEQEMRAASEAAESENRVVSRPVSKPASTNASKPVNRGNKRSKGNKGVSKPSLKIFKNNKEANKIAEKLGFDGAEDLKEYYVSKSNISKFNIKI